MNLPHYWRAYEHWAPVLARIIFGAMFLMGASMKIPGTESFTMEVGMTAAAGVPFAMIAVTLALILEVVAGVSLIIGWHARTAAFVLAIFTLALAIIFYSNWSDQMVMGQFISHLGLMSGLIYVSVFGAKHVAVKRD
jgi:putative oxidoreductase